MENGLAWQYILSGEMESGQLFTIRNSTRAILDNRAFLYGTKGYVEIPEYWKARRAIFHIEGQEPEILEFPCAHELVYEVRHIHKCLSEGRNTSDVVTEELSVAGIAALEGVQSRWEEKNS